MKFLTLLAVVVINSCYYYQGFIGQLDINLNKQSIEKVLKNNSYPQLNTELKAINLIKEFAINIIKLSPTTSYDQYYHTEKPGITHVITASYPLQLKSKGWYYLFVGDLPFRGFFNEEMYQEEYANLQVQGYDLWSFYSIAYSTLGVFDDPVTTPMLNEGISYLAESIIHEMVHETLFIKNEADFNEQLASFVASQASQEFMQLYRYPQKEKVQNHSQQLKQQEFDLLLLNLKNELQEIYQSTISTTNKLAQKELLIKIAELKIGEIYPHSSRIFRTINNARLLQLNRYQAQESELTKIWLESNQNWTKFWQLIKQKHRLS